jgi:hypothetical protein
MKFRRHTHNPDGSYRFDERHPGVKHWDQVDEVWVLHILDPKEAISFDSLVRKTHEYNKQNYEKLVPLEAIALALVRLLEDDLVEVVQ